MGSMRAYRLPNTLTFRTVSGGRLRCNQKKDLPSMGSKAAETLSRTNGRMAPATKPKKPLDNSGKPVQEITAKQGASHGDPIKCPFACGGEIAVWFDQTNHCPNCRGRVYVNYPVRPQYRYW